MSDVLHTIVNPELFNSKLSGVNTDDCRGAYRDYSPIEAKYEINGEIVLYHKNGECETISAEYNTFLSDSFLYDYGFILHRRYE